MADAADLAAELDAARIDVAIARVRPAIPNGAPGACEECGEDMPRLVGGRCGYCRDGRRPRLSRFDDPPSPRSPAPGPAPQPSPPKKCMTMPTAPITADSQTISVPAKGAVLAAIKARAARDEEPLGRSAAALIADALDATSLPAHTDLTVEQLLDILRAKLMQGVSATVYEAALARAEAAEARLALIGGVISGHVAPAGAVR